MKPFDLEAAKRGDPLICRDGVVVTFVAHVPHHVDTDSRFLVLRGGYVIYFSEDGKYWDDGDESNYDLFMAPKKKTIWVNFYNETKSGLFYESELKADEAAAATAAYYKRIGNKAIPVEIEE